MKAVPLRAVACLLLLLVCAVPLFAAPPRLSGAGTPLLPEGSDFIPDLQVWIRGWSPQGAVLIVSWQMYRGDFQVTVWDAVNDKSLWDRSINPEDPNAADQVRRAVTEAAALHDIREGSGVIKSGSFTLADPAKGRWNYGADLGRRRVGKDNLTVFDVLMNRDDGRRVFSKKIGEFSWHTAGDGSTNFTVAGTYYVLSPFERRGLTIIVYGSPHMEFDWETFNFSLYGCYLDEGFKPAGSSKGR